MSAKTTGVIWDLAVSVPWRMVLLAMVDHADHDGAHMRASQAFIAWKTGYSTRNVSRVMQDMIGAGLLILTDESIGQENEYCFDLTAAKMKPKFKGRKPKAATTTHDKMSGVKRATYDKMSGVGNGTHDKMASPPDKMSGDTHAKMAIDSSKYHVGVGSVGVGDRAREDLFIELRRRKISRIKAEAICATTATPADILASIDNLYDPSNPATMGGVINLLIDAPPEQGHPYAKPEQRSIGLDAADRRKPSERIGERPALPPGLKLSTWKKSDP